MVVSSLVLAGVAFERATLVAPSPTLILRDRLGRFLAEVGSDPNADAGYWPLEKLPEKVVATSLAAEDRRFFEHAGVDFRAVLRALWQNATSAHRKSGASTIAMQVARMQDPGPRTYFKKGLEALTAYWLVLRYGREAVLNQYLRIVPYGNRIRGISYAARRYLDKPVADLSWAEAGFLAALPQSPGHMNPLTRDGRAKAVTRARWILRTLHDQGTLSADDYEIAFKRLETIVVPTPTRRPESSMHVVLYLERRLGACLEHGTCPELAFRPIIDTTLDLDVQEAVSRRVKARLLDWQPDGAGNAAVIVVDAQTSEVVAWVGSGDYQAPDNGGAIDFTQVRRSPGSALKPFFYALALERGDITPATVLADIRRPDGLVANADDHFLGPMVPRVALANSRNVPAVEVLERIGLGRTWDFLGDLRLHDSRTAPGADALGYGMVLGNLAVSLADLVRAYTVFTNEGRFEELSFYHGQTRPPPRRLLSSDTARQVALFLSDPASRLPTFPRMSASEYPFPVAIKTGTSSGFHDAWSVAWSTRYLVGVWVGHPDYRPMRSLSGHRSAAVLARDVIYLLPHADAHGLADLSFPPPRSSVPVRLCTMSGKRATDACERVTVEWFRSGTEPLDSCDVHLRHAVDKRSGLLATSATPTRLTEERTFVNLPAEYGEWAASEGLPTTPRFVADSAVSRHPDEKLEATFAAQALTAAQGANRALVRVKAPRDGMRIVRDPEVPLTSSTLGLFAIVKPPVAELVWYVDGAPFKTVGYPYAARWPLAPGEHTFQARLAYQPGASQIVRVRIE